MIKAYAIALALSTSTAAATTDQQEVKAPATKTDFTKLITQAPELSKTKRHANARAQRGVRF